MFSFRKILGALAALVLTQTNLVFATAVGLDPSGYALYSGSGSLSINNLSSISVNGNIRDESSTCTFNNLSTISITGSVVCNGSIKFNNISSGSVSGVVQSLAGVTIPKGFKTGGATVVNSMGSLSLTNLSAPSGTSDANYALPITIVNGDYTINSSVSLSGTIYATGDIHINNGNITGSGTLVAGGGIHLNNLSSVGSSNAQLFLYSLGAGGIDTNNISTLTVNGSLYAPAGAVKLNNISSVTVTGGIFGSSVSLNNISSLTVGAGNLTSGARPPGIPNPLSPPAAPSNLTASAASFTSVGLTWISNSNNESNFLIERSGDGVTFTQVGSVAAKVTAYLDANLPTNATYYYRVRATNSAGNSAYTNVASATLLSPPNAPTNLVATVNGSEIDLSWVDNSSNEASFKIERSTDGNNFTEIASVNANVTTYADAGLNQGTYYYRVRAQNSAGYSSYTNNANGTVAGATNPCDSTSPNSGYNSDDPDVYTATVAQCGLLMKIQ